MAAAQIDRGNGMRLRPAVVDHVFFPSIVGFALEPEDAVIVRHRRNDVRPSIVINVCSVHESDIAQLPIGMELPITCPRVAGRFEPAIGSENIIPAIAVHITRADPVAVAL